MLHSGNSRYCNVKVITSSFVFTPNIRDIKIHYGDALLRLPDAGSKISHKIRHCVCQSVESGRIRRISVKSDYLSWEVLP